MEARIAFTAHLFQEGSQIIAYCPEFNVSSFGDTPEEARSSLEEAVSLFIEECQRMGTLEEVLEECRYRLPTKPGEKLVPPNPISIEELEIAIA